MSKRKICVVTGSRAEYGLLYWLMKEIQQDPDLELQVAVTGMHLSPEFGMTYKEIDADGFEINARVEMLLSSDSPVGIAKSIGLGVIGFADVLERLQPDILVLLGDRFEILAAAQAAMTARIPIAHIHGGEATQGLIDEAIRHAITKMSHLHFTAADAYRRRVIQMGEQPERVLNVGAMGLDNFTKLNLISRSRLETELGFKFGDRRILLCTYHPLTLDESESIKGVKELLHAVDQIPDANLIFTKGNADTGGRVINSLIDEYVLSNPEKAASFNNLGQIRYLSLLKESDVVIGNSSSGVIEAPMAKTATVNIGDRQRGRIKAASIIDCKNTRTSIHAAIMRALSLDFQRTVAEGECPLGDGNASLRIKQYLKDVSLEGILFKTFYDLAAN